MQHNPTHTQRITPWTNLRSLYDALPDRMQLTCLFGSFVFLQFTVLGLANHAGEDLLTKEQRDLVYYALQVFVILGFVLHSVFARFCDMKPKISEIRNRIAYAVFGLLLACAAVLLFTGTGSVFYVAVSMAAVLCIGLIGGETHLRMSMETVMGMEMAKCMGIGSAFAVILQYLLQIRWGVTGFLPLFMLVALGIIFWQLSGEKPVTRSEGYKKPACTPSHRILISVLIAAVFILFACFYNEHIHHLQIQSDYGTYNVYTWPRLVLVPGYLLFAVIGDKKGGKYVPITSLCIMLIMLLNAILTGSPEYYWLNMCMFYAAIAAFTSYYLLTFWRLAPGTRHPAIWASFGRMLDSIMVLFTGAIHLSSLPSEAMLGLDIAGVVLIILLMAVGGDFTLTKTAETERTAAANEAPNPAEPRPMTFAASQCTPEETLDRMRQLYALTPRETEVLRELVLTEDKQTVISERLSIQVKTLQDYVTRLYRKTGVTTRAGLMDLYHETRNRV